MTNKAISESLASRLAQHTAKDREQYKTESGSNRISIRGKKFRMGEIDLGTEMSVVIVGSSREQAYFDSPYDRDSTMVPACFSISEKAFQSGNIVAPHEESPAPQSDSCNVCPLGAWTNGEKPLCKTGLRLALLAYGDKLSYTEMAFIKLPPTSIKAFNKFVTKATSTSGLPLGLIVVDLSFDDEVDVPKLEFQRSTNVLSEEEMTKCLDIMEDKNTSDLLNKPYNTSGYEEPSNKGNSNRRSKMS